MSNKLTMSLLRTVASILISGATAAMALYPSQQEWLAPVIAVGATLGIHAIPSIQGSLTSIIPTVVKGLNSMTEQSNPPTELDGAALMGVRAPVTDTSVPAAPEPSVPPPAAVDAPVVIPVPPAPPSTPSIPVTPSQLRDLATYLENLS